MTWDSTKPSSGALALSQEIRQNWEAIERQLGLNLAADPTLLIWAAGDSAAPAHYSLVGAGAAIARTGTGLADTSRKIGKFAAKVTAGGGAAAQLEQDLLPSGDYDDGFDLGYVSALAFLKSGAGNAGRLFLDDGAGSPSYSTYHSGGGAWEAKTVTRQISASATKLKFGLDVAAGQNAHVSGFCPVLGPVPPQAFLAPYAIHDFKEIFKAGTLVTGNDQLRFHVPRPILIKDVFAEVRVAPTGADLVLGINTWNGGTPAFETMFSESAPDSRVRIVAANRRGSSQPDGVYARRCMIGIFGSGASATGNLFNVDIDQVGSTVAGADLTVQIRYLTFLRPLELFLSYAG